LTRNRRIATKAAAAIAALATSIDDQTGRGIEAKNG
jgi:hypothetical protein